MISLVRNIIASHESDIPKQIVDPLLFQPLVKELSETCQTFEPEEARPYLCSIAVNEYSEYVYRLKREGKLDQGQTFDLITMLVNTLGYEVGWQPNKAGQLQGAYFRAHRWLENPYTLVNPFETMGTEYMLQMYEGYLRLNAYFHTNEFLKLLDTRLMPYFKGEFHEALQGGTINQRKIAATFDLLKLLNVKLSPEFAYLRMVGEAYTKEVSLNESTEYHQRDAE